MNYTQSLKYLYSFLNYEVNTAYSYPRDLNLKRMAAVMKRFGYPERKGRFLLVGGTKGKGSTACLLESILRRAGYRTGLYVSPHLREPLERISFGGKKISKRDFAGCLTAIRNKLTRHPIPDRLGEVTFFELLTSAAFLYFRKKKTQIAVLEVGMGGRLDATNRVLPLVSVMTPVSFDHQDKLGKTLAAISREKIAILKDRGVLVSAPQAPSVRRFFVQSADKKKARSYFQGRDFTATIRGAGADGSIFDFENGQDRFEDLFVSLPGLFQIDNAACAVQAVLALRQVSSLSIPEKAVRSGLAKARWPGRFQQISRKPLVLLDGAHNGASFRALRESVQTLFPGRAITMILALSKGKDWPRIVREIRGFGLKALVITESKTPRACPASVLLKRARGAAARVEISPGLKEAMQQTLNSISEKDLVLVTGSLFLVGEAQTLFEATPQPAGVV
jgi:dihydrofolate synthase/folylpolyglutamate synthase